MVIDPERIAPDSLAFKVMLENQLPDAIFLLLMALVVVLLFPIIPIITSSMDATGRLPMHLILSSTIETPGTSGKENRLP
jgi:hypothetical protein